MSVFWWCFILSNKSPTTQCLIFLGHFAMSTPTFFKFHRHFLYFTNVGPVGFLAKTRCAYCTCNKLVIRTNILFQCFPLNYQIYCLGHCYSPCTWTNNWSQNIFITNDCIKKLKHAKWPYLFSFSGFRKLSVCILWRPRKSIYYRPYLQTLERML